MNNNEMNFDPMTGQPINNAEMNFDPMTGQPINNNQNIENSTIKQTNEVIQPVQQNISQTQNTINIEQEQMQNIPTVEQSKQDFINNTQALNTEKKEQKKDGVNYAFIIILFVIIFAAIFFLFPILLKYI